LIVFSAVAVVFTVVRVTAITSDETSLTVSRTETVENNAAVYEYGSYIKLTPPTENYEGTVEEYAENLLDQLYGFGDDEYDEGEDE
jgi:hypothetical protein